MTLDRQAINSLRDESVAAIERALQLSGTEVTRQLDIAERSVVRLRDALIEASRSDSASDPAVQSALRQANMALSLIVGVEYPAAAIQKSLLEQARDTLKELQASSTTL